MATWSPLRVRGRFVTIALLGLAACLTASPAPTFADIPPDYAPVAYAIKGAKIIAGRGVRIENGTIVIRRGVIEALGPVDHVTIPFDAETIDGAGLVVYPGFLDLYTTLGVPAGTPRSRTGSGKTANLSNFALAQTPEDDRHGITPEFEVANVLDLSATLVQSRRKLGFTDLLAAPGGAIATGQSAFASLGGQPRREAILRGPVALHINLQPPFEPAPPRDPGSPATPTTFRSRPFSGPRAYPVALMGCIATLRQAFLDSEHQHELRDFHARHGGPRPPFDPALDTLSDAQARSLSVWWEANSRDEIHRALDLAEEFGTDAVIVGGREAGQVAERLKALDVPVVLRVDFPDEPKAAKNGSREKSNAAPVEPARVLADRVAQWKERVGTAAALAKAGVRFGFASDGLTKPETFPAQVRKTIQAGLSADAALDALTRQAAEIAGLGDRLGTLETGKLGHLIALSGPYENEKSKLRFVMIDGAKFDIEKPNTREQSGPTADDGEKPKQPKLEAEPDTQQKRELAHDKDRPSDKAKEKDQEKEKEKEKQAEKSRKEPDPKPVRAGETPARMNRSDPRTPANVADVATELDEDRKPRIKTSGDVLVKDAVILTVGPEGNIPRGSILIRGGKIAAIGPNLEAPAGIKVIDAHGLVAMPGIIDTHSHIAIQGGVNESSLSMVPEVRVRDVVQGDDIAIYRALAGGTTTARLLHGSANTIGGQDAVIKLRYGQPARDLILRDPKRPQGVKFALGENVTRLTGRFPNTRMGVEATLERAFEEARAYQRRLAANRAASARGESAPPMRRDLRLEALAGILDGSIKIHSHCYRADEILMLMGVAERHGIRVQSFQHVLEGYKVAPEIAAHGASASTFSDWWAYKVEAYDAIPFNAALLTEAGVRVCIKSDDSELMRHLNLEAAKMVRYGGTSEHDALAMVTLNPARELGLDHRLGSLEVGKDGDIALFNAHPLDSYARCELALIDGEVWFQRGQGDLAMPRPGEHLAMPRPTNEALAKTLNLTRSLNGAYALTGATIHTVAGAEIPNGTLVIAGGKIADVGGPETIIPDGTRTLDLRGLHLWPGMIDGGSVVGLFDIGSLRETQDHADSAQIQPELHTGTALHADSELIPVTRFNGVLAAFIQPTAGQIAGQGCVIKLDGWVPRDLILEPNAALCINIPTSSSSLPLPEGFIRSGGGSENDPEAQRDRRLEPIREPFRRALEYGRIVSESEKRGVAGPIPDPRLSALLPYARGERPVFLHAEKQLEILDALALAKELKLKAVITGGLEAWKVASELKAADVPVLIAGTLQLPSAKTDPYDAPYANPAKLHEAGVRIGFRSRPGGPDAATRPRNIPFEAATAVAFGLPEPAAIRAVTLGTAEILGVADRLGSIEKGKLANVVITAGPLLQATSEVKGMFIAGVPVPARSKQSDLYDKYRRRLAEVRDRSTAPPTFDQKAPQPRVNAASGR